MENTINEIRKQLLSRLWLGMLWCLFLCFSAAHATEYYFHNGTVVTMDADNPVASAVLIKDDKIIAVGSEASVKPQKSANAIHVDLKNGALLPGFVEPHMHIAGQIEYELLNRYVVSPCLPQPYELREKCPLFIEQVLTPSKNFMHTINGWFLGIGLDPSRMAWNATKSSEAFHQMPSEFINATLFKKQRKKPVFMLDQSGHLGYVNTEAFVKIGHCKKVATCNVKDAPPPSFPSGGQWETDASGNYTGLLVEASAMAPFFNKIVPLSQMGHKTLGIPGKEIPFLVRKAALKHIASTGVTTAINGGSQSTEEQLLVKALASENKPVLRIRDLIAIDLAKKSPVIPAPNNWPQSNNGIYASAGIKLWADGSTQGCTANLTEPYQGQCEYADKGHQNYNTKEIVALLQPYWNNNWYINVHANGDQALEDTLNAFAAMQCQQITPYYPTLIHATVAGKRNAENIIDKIKQLRNGQFRCKNNDGMPALAVETSHLIAHVAYWGYALSALLDKDPISTDPKDNNPNARIQLLDATESEHANNIPFSLHSDSPVSPVNPLWYVEQAVTRRTWQYPNLKTEEALILPGNQEITIAQALQAITLIPARQHHLDKYIGSIESGKIADLVVLDANPLDYEAKPDKIHKISVLETYVNGYRNKWQ